MYILLYELRVKWLIIVVVGHSSGSNVPYPAATVLLLTYEYWYINTVTYSTYSPYTVKRSKHISLAFCIWSILHITNNIMQFPNINILEDTFWIVCTGNVVTSHLYMWRAPVIWSTCIKKFFLQITKVKIVTSQIMFHTLKSDNRWRR